MIWVVILTFTLFIVIPSTTFAANIKINEFYAAGSTSSNPDWVEIYNQGLDISLYQLIDAVNNKKDLAGANCNGNFCTIDWYNSLNNGGDTIKLVLKTSPDLTIDQVIYAGDVSIPGTGQSAGRNSDGTGGWVIFSTPTKGTTNNTGTSTPSPTPTPTPTLSPTSSATSSTSSTSSFTISNTPSQINSDQSFTVSVNLTSSNNPNTNFYLKGAFRHPDKPSNYFGLTKVGSSWVKNSVTATSQLQITTDTSGNWTGNIEVQPDSEDSGYTGTDDYIFKVGRYTSAGSGPTWSNETTVKIINTSTANQEVASSNTSTSSTYPSSLPQTSRNKVTNSVKSKSYDRLVYHTASVAAATASASPSPSVEVKVKKRSINFIPWIGVVLVIAGIGSLIFTFLTKSKRQGSASTK